MNREDSNRKENKKVIAFGEDIEFIINGEVMKVACREEKTQFQAGQENINRTIAESDSVIIKELIKKTKNKEKIEIPMELSEEVVDYFLKFFEFSSSTWLSKVSDRVDCFLEFLPVFEFLSLRETASSILQKQDSNRKENKKKISFGEDIEFIINGEVMKAACREESTQVQACQEDINKTIVESDSVLIKELINKTKNKEKIEIPMELSDEGVSYFLKFFEFSSHIWLSKVSDSVDCLFEFLPVFEFLSLRETASSILQKIEEYITNNYSSLEVSMKVDILKSLLTTYFSSTIPNPNSLLFDSNLKITENLVNKVLINTSTDEKFCALMCSLTPTLISKEVDILRIINLFERYTCEQLSVNGEPRQRALINIYFYSVVKQNPGISEHIDKAFLEPLQVNRLIYLDTKELEDEVRSMIDSIEDMIAKATFTTKDINLIKQKRNSDWSKEYKKLKDSFIKKLLSDELELEVVLNKYETTIREEYTLLNKKNDNKTEITSNTMEEKVKELTTKVMQMQEYISIMNTSNSKEDRLKELTLMLNRIPELKNTNTMGKEVKSTNDTLNNMIVTSNLFKSVLVNSFTGNNDIGSLCLMSDRELVSGSFDGTISIFDLIENKRLTTFLGHKSKVASLFQWDENTFISGSFDNSIKIWDLKKRECVAAIGNNVDRIYSVRKFNNELFISGSEDKTIKVWDFKERQSLKTLKGHTDTVYSLCVMTEKIFVSGSKDNTIKVWDIDNDSCLKTLKGHTNWVYDLCKVNDEQFVSASFDYTLKIW
eukprot:CAMPEP_0170537408 /NCGR_PEP_ID=MMETSP0209-20121228/102696_1 /TAXON_ID=665100 ORGANISM="Litonotus pictus, Strain P1" /NCGR_SAMPLE_ID=MMETSP0209 /ASSEMBLY_ACC=CAM_ASM_000301 /LENGTH=771 /DNA_ID=CAMNT_0010838901 /DNA_START=15 /DNA_END=2327 /DNA_ORIENTATION=-